MGFLGFYVQEESHFQKSSHFLSKGVSSVAASSPLNRMIGGSSFLGGGLFKFLVIQPYRNRTNFEYGKNIEQTALEMIF